MTVNLSESRQPTSVAELDSIEARIGVRLPSDYRAFLLHTNGGRPAPRIFDFVTPDGRKERSAVHFFLAATNGPGNNLETTFHAYKLRGKRIPDPLIPIANDSFGNQICLAVTAPNAGAVYFWDHEREADEGDEPTMDNISPIADSFAAFLESLY